MSRQVIYSLIGMEQINPNVLHDFNYPDTFTADDKESFNVELMAQTAELELVYSDSKVMQLMIKAWSRRRKPIWDHLIDTTKYDYDPIKNWDRTEHTTESETRNLTDNGTVNNSQTENSTHSGSEAVDNDTTTTVNGTNSNTSNGTNSNTSNGTSALDVAGFDSSTLVPREKTTNANTTNITNTNTTNITNSDTTVVDGTVTTTATATDTGTVTGETTTTNSQTGTITREYTHTASGNVGTLTTQAMIKEEREIATFDIVQFMIEDFKERFCLLIY